MLQSQSPRRPASADLPAEDAIRHPQSVFHAPRPVHPQHSLLTAPHTLSIERPPMATAFQDSPQLNHLGALNTQPGALELDPMFWCPPSTIPNHSFTQYNAGLPYAPPFTSGSQAHSHFSQHDFGYNEHYDRICSSQYPILDHSHPNHSPQLINMPQSMSTIDSYPPTAYQIEPQKHYESMDSSDTEINGQLTQLSNDYKRYEYNSRIKIEPLDDYRSPYSNITRASTPQNDTGYDGNMNEEHPIDKTLPYAQLIYQALLQAPNHTMILRDIYEWFQLNTDKAADSQTKGWQNSIRHNLSMNGVSPVSSSSSNHNVFHSNHLRPLKKSTSLAKTAAKATCGA